MLYFITNQINWGFFSILGVLIVPMFIFAVFSLLFGGIENILYSLLVGGLSLSLIVQPENLHHTMSEFVFIFSIISPILFAPLYILPSMAMGIKMPNFAYNPKLKKILYPKMILINVLNLFLILFVQFIVFSCIILYWK